MTYDDDFIQLPVNPNAPLRVSCKRLGLDWPPPERLELEGVIFKRIRYSSITDEQREVMTHVVRGAEYQLDANAILGQNTVN